MKVVVTCAGTGGHKNPGIAIANILISIAQISLQVFFNNFFDSHYASALRTFS